MLFCSDLGTEFFSSYSVWKQFASKHWADLMCVWSQVLADIVPSVTLSTESHRLRWDHVTLILRCGRHIGHPRCLPSSPDSPGSTLTQCSYSLWCRFGSLCPCFVCVEVLVLSTNNCYHHATKDWSCTSHFPARFCWLSCRPSSHLELRTSQLLVYVESVRVFVCVWKVFGRFTCSWNSKLSNLVVVENLVVIYSRKCLFLYNFVLV